MRETVSGYVAGISEVLRLLRLENVVSVRGPPIKMMIYSTICKLNSFSIDATLHISGFTSVAAGQKGINYTS